ncbi:PKD domain-containing protein [Mycetocola reblochoni]|uniref:Chitinase n=2 Tax=Mycetocola reblochoni TaxID=331618 RepID=A0A1R4JFU4_9MICO|nr:PKD domain-containing protein [Mycetocola reblochoni]SJN30804.1 Chitinase [Mycetocola reblochoni REB411]
MRITRDESERSIDGLDGQPIGLNGRCSAGTAVRATRRAVTIAVAGILGIAVSFSGAAPASADPEAANARAAGVATSTSSDRADGSTSTGAVTADALPAPQIDGVVWDQVVIGDTVYAGGSFTTARPAGARAGTDETRRTNLLAYSLSSGKLIESFAPELNGQVKTLAASPDGTTLYLGGQFTSVDGSNRYRIAAIDVATSRLTSWRPTADATVNSIVATADTVYVGGVFSKFQLQPRTRAAAVDARTGVIRDWAPVVAGGTVSTMVLSPDGDKLVIGGNFTSVNSGVSATGRSIGATRGMAAVDSDVGSSLEWKASSVVKNGGSRASITSLGADENSVYGSGYENSASRDGNLEGTFRASWSDGSLLWLSDCHGDSYSIAPAGDTVYVASHAHYCGNLSGGGMSDYQQPDKYYRATAMTTEPTGVLARNSVGTGTYANFQGQPSPSLREWLPKMNTGTFTGMNQGPWDVTVAGDYVLYAGEFRQVNGKGQQGLVRFSTDPASGKRVGPELSGTDMAPSVTEVAGSVVSLSWRANWDRDDESLRYQVIRDGDVDNPVAEVSGRSHLWNRPMLTAVDPSASPRTTYEYQIRTVDGAGNATMSDSRSFTTTTAGETTLTSYDAAVLNAQPKDYWSLSEARGTTAANWARGTNPIALGDRVVRHVAGSEVSGEGRATRFGAGTTSTGTGTATLKESASQIAMTELWVRTESDEGGVLAASVSTTGSFWNKREAFDRLVSLGTDGRVRFGGSKVTSAGSDLASSVAVNDGEWHHVVAGSRDGTAVLFVDGELADSAPAGAGSGTSGSMRIGGETVSGIASVVEADIDNVANYATAISDRIIGEHYRLGAVKPNVPPKAGMTLSADGLTLNADAGESSDGDGEIVSYTWDLGDGASAIGSYITHEYTRAGSYDVTLTVTDDAGATAETSERVTVAADHVLAVDEFDRDTASGWGIADVGGAWATRGARADYAVDLEGGAQVRLAPGASRSAVLGDVVSGDASLSTSVTLSDAPSGAGVYPTLILRESSSGSYTVRAWVRPNDDVQLQVLRGSTVVARASVAGLRPGAGQAMNLRATIGGTGNTTIAARAWIGDDEPEEGPLAFTDSAAAAGSEGLIGLGGYQSGSATGEQTIRFARVQVDRPEPVEVCDATAGARDAAAKTAREFTESELGSDASSRVEPQGEDRAEAETNESTDVVRDAGGASSSGEQPSTSVDGAPDDTGTGTRDAGAVRQETPSPVENVPSSSDGGPRN